MKRVPGMLTAAGRKFRFPRSRATILSDQELVEQRLEVARAKKTLSSIIDSICQDLRDRNIKFKGMLHSNATEEAFQVPSL